MNTSHEAYIEAILFFRAVPVKISELTTLLAIPETEIYTALDRLEMQLAGRGLQLVHKDNAVLLTTSKDTAGLIEKIAQEDLEKDLGKAGLETLAIILYRGPVTRSDIDYIRGVNSNFILRNLMIRGLVEKVVNPEDKRGFLYKPTFELLSYLGITRVEDLSEYSIVRQEIEGFEHNSNEDKNDKEEEYGPESTTE